MLGRAHRSVYARSDDTNLSTNVPNTEEQTPPETSPGEPHGKKVNKSERNKLRGTGEADTIFVKTTYV